jgi:hypothetical protein
MPASQGNQTGGALETTVCSGTHFMAPQLQQSLQTQDLCFCSGQVLLVCLHTQKQRQLRMSWMWASGASIIASPTNMPSLASSTYQLGRDILASLLLRRHRRPDNELDRYCVSSH